MTHILPLKLLGLGDLNVLNAIVDIDLALILEAVDNKGALLFGKELCRLGEIVEQEEGRDGNENGGDAFEDEDPAPAFETADAVHFADGEGEKATKCAGDGGGGEEHGLAELDLVAAVPHGEVVL